MAGDWIPIEITTPRKTEVLKFARLAGIPRHEALGVLVELWTWADSNSVDGYVDIDVDMLASTLGTHTRVLNALIETGWLVKNNNDSLFLPNAKRWLGKSAKARLTKNRAQSEWRDRKNVDNNVDTKTSTHVDNNTSTNLSTRVEKSREENIKKDTSYLKKNETHTLQLQSSKEIWPGVFDEELKSLFKKFLQHCVDIGKRPSDAMVDKFKGQCVSMGKSRSIAALQNSIEKRAYTIWEPFYETKQTNSFSKQKEEQDKPRRNFWRGHYRDINGDPEDDDGNPINEDGTPRTVNK